MRGAFRAFSAVVKESSKPRRTGNPLERVDGHPIAGATVVTLGDMVSEMCGRVVFFLLDTASGQAYFVQ